MTSFRTLLAASALALVLTGCPGGGGDPAAKPPPSTGTPPPPTPPNGQPPVPDAGFRFHDTPPHASPLPQLGWDVASPHQNGGFPDGAGVLVYTEKDGQLYVLLARRADWLLNGKGTWGAFGGTVEPSDLDDAGNRSFSRAAEHELYEESVTVYHQTDANDLRNGATHLHHPPGRAAFRTFFSRQDYVPAERFDEGYTYARQHKALKFWENDQYLWVRMDEFKACVAARKRTATFTDPAGAGHTLNLFGGFTRVFRSTFLHQLNNLH